METYTEKEWKGAIASVSRTRDIRNFPDAATKWLLGEVPVCKGLGYKGKKYLDPKIVLALMLWTKGPVEMLFEHEGMWRVLETYDSNQAVIGLQLTVTGMGGTFIEPRIPTPEETAEGLAKVLETGLVDPDAVQLRYDPLVRIECPDGSIMSNANMESFENVVSLFARLGIRHFSTKFMLLSEFEAEQYKHVYDRITDAGLLPLEMDNKEKIFKSMLKIAAKYGAVLKTCCVRVEQKMPHWMYDSGCLSSERLAAVGKKRFGKDWDRITSEKRESRTGCLCNRYWDLGTNTGFKLCGSSDAACLYCTASAKKYGRTVLEKAENELNRYLQKKGMKKYEHLVVDSK